MRWIVGAAVAAIALHAAVTPGGRDREVYASPPTYDAYELARSPLPVGQPKPLAKEPERIPLPYAPIYDHTNPR
jgi:hypothetical protein